MQDFYILRISIIELKGLMDEFELYKHCKHKEKGAYKDLYETYGGYLYSIALRYIPDRSTAEDLLHDCFLKIFKSINKFEWRGKGSLKGWMARIMINEAIETIRKNKFVSLPDFENYYNDLSEPSEEETALVPLETLKQFISELPDGYRMVFNLFVFENYSHKEIASILGIEPNSSASQFFRARQVLAQKIKQWLKEHE